MTKQMTAAMAAMLMVGVLPMQAQEPLSTTTKTVKVAPGETKTTVITKEAGAAGTKSAPRSGAKRRTTRRKTAAKQPPAESANSRMLRELQEKQTAQQAEIDALTQANAAKDAALAQAQANAQAAETQAQNATQAAQTVNATVQQNADAVQALKTNVTDLQTTNAGLASTISANKVELNDKIESPASIHYKGVTLTPVGFFAFEGVWRQRSINSDINTPFNTTPYPGSNEGHISELNFTGRQSRLAALFEGKASSFKLSGYVETDFLSAGASSNNNQSNSYTLRVRQVWGKAETNSGLAVTGGQTWTLVTEDGKSTDARTEKLPNTVDPQYMVGFSWARQPGIRLQQKFGGASQTTGATLAISLEQAQIQLGTTQNAPTNFIFGGAGQSGGLYNAYNGTYANNVAPDTIAKFAFDTPHAHFEVGGLARFFRDELNPLIYTTTGTTTVVTNSTAVVRNTKLGGGAFGAARVSVSKFADVAVQGMFGDGTGRYGSAQLGDVTVHPDGTLEPIRNYHGLFSLETHPAPKLDVYAYYGAEYNQRTYYTSPTGTLVGYGTPNTVETGCAALTLGTATGIGTGGTSGAPGAISNCSPSTRDIQEGMIGFTYRVVNSPKYGRLQYQATYSYLTKAAWRGVLAGTYPNGLLGSGHAENNMIHVSMRYYIP